MIKFFKEVLFPRIIAIIKGNLGIYFVVLLVAASYFVRIFEFFKRPQLYFLNTSLVKVYKDGNIDAEVEGRRKKFKLYGIVLPKFYDKCSSSFKKDYKNFLESQVKINDRIDLKVVRKSIFLTDSVRIFKNNIDINNIVIKKFGMDDINNIDFCQKDN